MLHTKKNIGFFTVGLLSYSGAALQALKVAGELEGYSVLFFNKEPAAHLFRYKTAQLGDHKVIVLPKFLPFRFFTIAGYIVKYGIRICHFHCFVIRNMLPCLLLGRKIILKTTLMGEDDLDTQIGDRRKLPLRFILSKISYNVVLTKNLQRINQKYLPREKVKVVYNGITVQDAPAPKEGNIFCSIGLVCPRKRTWHAIQYFSQHYARLPGARLYIIGPNDTSSGLSEFSQEYYDSCTDLVRRNNLQSQVIFTGKLPLPDVFKLCRQAKGTIFLSSKEGFPNGILEAMSFNCVPLISPMDGVAEEMIADGTDGYIIADETRGISIEDIDRISRSENAYKRVNRFFSIRTTAAMLSELYDRIS
ncbi:MAG: glycosyltransferase family 4 protein [Prevotellaceae bacterium]|jgi:glycosyltransferase involved in cell wall biosynthesis|nr:glycosyltransferase family 4 protein [Prevotellaceae bacterium]